MDEPRLTIVLTEYEQRIYDLASTKSKKNSHALCWKDGKKGFKNAVKKLFTEQKATDDIQKDNVCHQIALAYQAQALYRRDQGKAGEKLSQPVGISVWLNDGRYDIEIESHSALKEKTGGNCNCGKPINIGKHCWDCYDNLKINGKSRLDRASDERIAILKDLGLTEKVSERYRKIMTLTPYERLKWLKGTLRAYSGR